MKLSIRMRSVRTANTHLKASWQRVQPPGVRSANTRDEPEAGATDRNQFDAGATAGAI
jgi:hypothetical protein